MHERHEVSKIFAKKPVSLGTNVKKEITAGVTTFVTMAYIIIVNPKILEAAGMSSLESNSLGMKRIIQMSRHRI